MPFIGRSAANRLGFIVIGLTNNFIYVIMLSAAFDLLNQSRSLANDKADEGLNKVQKFNSSLEIGTEHKEPYCNEQSTSTILLANTLPALVTKIIYPFFLDSVPTAWKAIATALLAATAFLITGLFTSQFVIFLGVVCASLSFGLGESNFMSITPLYGDASLSGWSMGTGCAGLIGSLSYALMRMVLSVKLIMMILLIVPVILLIAYFRFIRPLDDLPLEITSGKSSIICVDKSEANPSAHLNSTMANVCSQSPEITLDFWTKVRHLRSLSKYIFPLLLVYFAEYLINQGFFELLYYPEIEYLDHAAQYRWFQVAYQIGVVISRSSVELIQLKNIWAMSILQFANALLFLAHTGKVIHLPNFYLVLVLIVYEGLLGGFTFVNAYYRIKKEAPPLWQEFSISTATIGDSLGIVLAGLVAIPVHDALCQLYV